MESTNLMACNKVDFFQELAQRSTKPRKSALRVQRRAENMEWIKKHAESESAEQPSIEPIAKSDSDDSIVDIQEETSDQRIYERAPSPIPNPFTCKELYLGCIRCPRYALIEHLQQSNLEDKLDCDLGALHSFALTVCRTCYNRSNETETQEELDKVMKSVRISPSYFFDGELFKSISPMSQVVVENGGIAYISLKVINDGMNDSCVLKSMIKINGGYIPSHLKGGFF
jgi:hypothetical protein